MVLEQNNIAMLIKKLLLSVFLLSSIYPSVLSQETSPSAPTNKIYNLTEVEKAPIFSKGKMSQVEFLKFYLEYPPEAIEKNLQGTVIITFTVAPNGEVISPRVLQGVDPILDKEALRVSELIPYYTPGYVGNNAVFTKILFPVTFSRDNIQQTALDSLPLNSSSISTAPQKAHPLFVIDGKTVNDNVNLSAENIATIRVIKGSKAVSLYGNQAKDGVIMITTKTKQE